MDQRIVRGTLVAISLAGLGLSGYLTFFSPGDSSFCNLNSLFSCDDVLTSEYAKIMGIPVALLGLVWFAAAAGLSFASFRTPVSRRMFILWAFVGVLGIPPLVYAEYLVGSICLLCTSAHILGLAFLGFVFFYRPSKPS
jgi:uncharacterized membrane protein